jgi:hypothetical protein
MKRKKPRTGEPPSIVGWFQATEMMSRFPRIRMGGSGGLGNPAHIIVTGML